MSASSGSPRPSIFSAVARLDASATTLLRAAGATAVRGGAGRGPGVPSGDPRRPGGGGKGRFEGCGPTAGGAGVSDARPVPASLNIATSSGKVRSGSHSSNPSRQTSDSSVMAPEAALRRSSLKRTGPTGTPLMPTYHSSVLELDDKTAIAADTAEGSSFGTVTAFEKAPARPAFPGPAPGRGAARGAPCRGGGPGGGGSALVRPEAPGGGDQRGGGATGGRGGGSPAAAARTAPCEPDTPVDAPTGPSSGGRRAPATDVSVTDASTSIMCPHLRHFIRTVRPATFSSAIWYLALQFSQRNFIGSNPTLSNCPVVPRSGATLIEEVPDRSRPPGDVQRGSTKLRAKAGKFWFMMASRAFRTSSP